jgi:cytochrome P450
MMLTTFAIIVETMLSGPRAIDADRVERSITRYLAAAGWPTALGIVNAPAWVPYPGRRRALAAARDLRAMVGRMVAERRIAAGERPDLVTLLLAAADPESGRHLSDAAMTDNLLTFMTAGHETTAQGLVWTLHLLARHPEIESAVLAEIDSVTGGEALQPHHVADLAYTRQVFAEAMRLYPPVPILTRRVETAFALAGRDLPAGTVLIVPVHALHRHARLWPDADVFDPGRFAPEAVRERHRYSYMPFGAGPRICIGSAFAQMEAVAILAVLLRAFRLRRAENQEPEPIVSITLRPRHPLRMTVSHRV